MDLAQLAAPLFSQELLQIAEFLRKAERFPQVSAALRGLDPGLQMGAPKFLILPFEDPHTIPRLFHREILLTAFIGKNEPGQ